MPPHHEPHLPDASSSWHKTGHRLLGGLDTRCAVAWLTRQGMRCTPTRRTWRSRTRRTWTRSCRWRCSHGAVAAALVDCRESMAREGIVAIQCGAFHLSVGGKKYFNTTPLGRAVTTTAIVRAMREDDVHVFGDGSTHKGNDIQRFYRYGILVDPDLKIYKPWLDRAFVDAFGGRKEMSEYLNSVGCPTDGHREGVQHRRQRARRHARGEGPRALSTSMKIVQPIMGVAPWNKDVAIEAETVTLEFDGGVPVSINGKRFATTFELFLECNRIGGRHGLGMSDQIENRVIDAKSRGIYEAPGMALVHLGYERLLSAIHNENTLDVYFTSGRRLGRLLYEGKWYDPEAMMLKDALTRWVAPSVKGTVTVELRRGDDYTILDTQAEYMAYGPDKLSMEKVEQAYFTQEDRIGALEMQNLSLMDNRAFLLHHLDSVKRLGAPAADNVIGRLLAGEED
ncbi:MAG: argininosuccinate synthase [Sandaracinaceae bacterium]|nr:argininosuccinate synthase [Sandaracinaceae bacterium]